MRRLHTTLAVIVLAGAWGSGAWADPPLRVPAERCTEDLGAPDYEISLELSRSAAQFTANLAFGWRDEGDFCLLTMSETGTALRRVTDGQAQVLDRTDRSALPPGQESAEVIVRRRWADVIVSAGHDVLARGFTEESLDGKAGAWAGNGAQVGEMLVQPLGEIEFRDDFFERETVPSRWETLRGSWQLGALWDPLLKRDRHPPQASWYEPGEGECLTATGLPFWDSYRLEATIKLRPDGVGGLAFHVRDADDFCALVIYPTQDGSSGTARLLRWVGGQLQVLAEQPGRFAADRWCRLGVDVYPGRAEGYLNGEPVVAADVPVALSGRAGLYAKDAAGSRFDDVSVTGLRAVRDELKAQQPERWLYRGGKWTFENGALCGQAGPGQVATLRAGQWDDCRVSATVGPGKGATAGLVAHHEFGDRAYLFTISAGGQPTWHLHAVTAGKTSKLAEGTAPAATGEVSLSFVGGRLTCSLEGQRLCRVYDFNVRPGRVGVYVGGGRATFKDLSCAELSRDPFGVVCDADGTGTRVPALEEKQMLSATGSSYPLLRGARACCASASRWRRSATSMLEPFSPRPSRFCGTGPGSSAGSAPSGAWPSATMIPCRPALLRSTPAAVSCGCRA